MQIVGAVCMFVVPFLLAGMIKSLINLKEKEGFGPLPYCFGMGILLALAYIFA